MTSISRRMRRALAQGKRPCDVTLKSKRAKSYYPHPSDYSKTSLMQVIYLNNDDYKE